MQIVAESRGGGSTVRGEILAGANKACGGDMREDRFQNVIKSANQYLSRVERYAGSRGQIAG
jgi:hypothetical protein